MGKPFQTIIRFFLLLLLAISVPIGSTAESFTDSTIELSEAEKNFLKANPVIRVHNEQNWAPFNYNYTGQPQGYIIDLIKLLAEKLDIQVEFITGPTWNEFLEMLKKKEIDVIGNMFQTKERDKFSLFTDPVIKKAPSIVSRADNPFKSLPQLEGKTVSVVKGFWYQEVLEKNFPNIRLYLVKNSLEALKSVVYHRADATLGVGVVLQHIWMEHSLPILHISGEANFPDVEGYYDRIGVRNDWPLLVSALNKALKAMTFEEEQQIKQKWLGVQNIKKSISDKPEKAENLLNAKLIANPPKKVDHPTFILFVPAQTNHFWKKMIEYATAMANDLSVVLEFLEMSDDIETLSKAVENACKKSVHGFIFQSFPGSENILKISAPYQIPCILINNDIQEKVIQTRKTYPNLIAKIIPNDRKAGYDLIHELIIISSKSYSTYNLHILAIDGPDLHKAAILRKKGRDSFLETIPDIASYKMISGDWTKEKASELFEQSYYQNPKINLVWASNDAAAIGVAERIKSLGIQNPIIVGGIDWTPETLQGLREGWLAASLGGHFFEAAWAILLLHDYINGSDFKFQALEFQTSMAAVTIKNYPLLNTLLNSNPVSNDFRYFSKIYNTNVLQYQLDPLHFSTLISMMQWDVSSKMASEKKQKQIPLTKEERVWLQKHPVIKVSNEMDYSPFDFMIGDQPAGFSIDLLNLLAEKTGLRIKYVNGYTWAELEDMFRQGSLDLLHIVAKTDERQAYGLFSDSYLRYKNHYAIRRSDPEITNVKDLYGKTLAVGKGYAQVTFFAKNHPQITLLRLESTSANLEAVSKGLADATISNDLLLRYQIKKHGFSNLKISGWAKELDKGIQGASHFMAQKDSPELISMLNKALDSMTIEEVDTLNTKWFGTETKQFFRRSDENTILADFRTRPPYMYIKNNAPYGPMIEIIEKLVERSGKEIQWQFRPFGNSLDALKAGETDLVPRGYHTKEREDFILYLGPLGTENKNVHFLMRKDDDRRLERYEDLNQFKIVVKDKGFYFKRFNEDGELNKIPLPEDFEMARAFMNHKADIIAYYDQHPLTAAIEQLGYAMSDFKIAPYKERFDIGLYIALSKNSPFAKDAQKFQSILDAMKTSGELEEIYMKYDTAKVKLTKEEKAYLKQKGAIKMSVLPDWLPYERINENGQHEGIGAEIIQRIAELIDTPIELLPTKDWEESLQNLRDRKCDILPIAMNVPSRRDTMNFSKPYVVEPFVIATSASELFIKDTKEIENKKIGIIKSYAFAEVLKQKYPDMRIVDVKNAYDGLKRVRTGKLFGYIDAMPTIGYTMQKYSMLDLKIAGKLEFNLEHSIASRNDEPLLAAIMQKAANSITDHERREIIQHWLAIRYEQGFDYTLFWKIMAVVAVVISVVLYWMSRMAIMNRKIRLANQAAEAATQAKSRFLANMSHEIRTPMNSILGFLELVLEDQSISELHRKHLTTAQISASSLMGLINDILDVSKLESGKLTIVKRPFNLINLMREIHETMNIIANAKGLTLRLDISPSISGSFIGDPLRLRQIMINLVGNAIKFTHEGGVIIWIMPTETEGRLHFMIEDTGIGIPENRLSQIFEPFTQAETSTTHRFGGTGLGTTISRELVELMNGHIWAESMEGKGSTFNFIIEIAPTDQVPEHDDLFIVPGKAIASGFRCGFKILLVDDVEANIDLSKTRLQQQGHDVTVAWNGREAVAAYQGGNFDVILMDNQMPEMDGIEATECIRKMETETDAHVPIIAMTAGITKDETDKYFAAGMDAVIAKPINFGKLFKALEKVVPKGVGESIQDITKQSNEQIMMELPPIDGVNIKKGLFIWQDLQAYKKALLKFSIDYGNSAAEISQFIEYGDMERAYRATHKLKGVAGNLWITDVLSISEELNTLLKEQRVDGLTDLLNSLSDALRLVVKSIEKLKDQTDKAEHPDERSDEHSGEELGKEPNIKHLTPVFKDMLKAFDQLDPAEIEPFLEALGQYLSTNQLKPIIDNLEIFNFDNAKLETIFLITSLGIDLEGSHG